MNAVSLTDTSLLTNTSALPTGTELQWQLPVELQADRALGFMAPLAPYFAVYSRTTQTLYLNYRVYLPSKNDCLVVLPGAAMHETFANIPETALTETSVRLLPGEALQRDHYWLSAKLFGGRCPEAMPLTNGLRVMLGGLLAEGPVLPVLVQGELRALPQQRLPFLQLHHLNLAACSSLSDFARKNLSRSLKSRLLRFNSRHAV